MRLVHPFPSVLDGVVVGAVAVLAGGGPELAARLGLSMTALQFAIGALNDLVDAPADAGRVPAKPIPAGLLSNGVARIVAVASVAVGVGLAATVGLGVAALALVGLAIGAAYDLAAKGTAWSWLPFAVGIPLLPVYGWYGAAAGLPSFFAALIPMAVLAGAALAIANALADLEHDQASGTASVATRLGGSMAWQSHAALWAAVVAIAVAWLAIAGRPAVGIAGVIAAGLLVAAAVGMAHGGSPEQRRRAWEFQAVAAAIALIVWLAAALG